MLMLMLMMMTAMLVMKTAMMIMKSRVTAMMISEMITMTMAEAADVFRRSPAEHKCQPFHALRS